MKKLSAILLSALMILSTAGGVMAEEIPVEYTQVKVFDGTYGFGDAEISAYSNDNFSTFYITFECFDEDQVLEGTIEDGIVNVEYDLTGFVAGDAQIIWDDAVASENPWEPVGGGEAAPEEEMTETSEEAAQDNAEEVEYDFENYTTVTTTGVLDWDLDFTLLPSGYNEAEPVHPMNSQYIHYTTDAYEDGVTYEKYVRVYTPYDYDPDDTETKYNVIYFQHGHGGTPNVFDGVVAPVGRPGADSTKLFGNMFDPDKQVMDPVIIVCTTYYMDLDEDATYDLNADRLAGDNTSTGLPANYYREVVEDIIPAVESQFNVYCTDFSEEGIKATRDHRAWAGYSRGSVCTWYMFHNDLEYFKYFMPTSAQCMPAGLGAENGEDEDAANEAAFQYIKEAIDAHPDLDFFIFASSGGDRDAVSMRTQMKYFVDQTDTFSYGLDPEVNNFYYTCADGFIHSDMFFPYYLYNAKDVLFQ